jgi:hypothetical protein
VHGADLSFLARGFDVSVIWVNLLFEEFFAQGDLQAEKNLPLSMLCNRSREHTYIPKS